MIKFAQMPDVGFAFISQLLNGYQLTPQLAEEHGTLGPAAEPLQVWDVLKRDFPVIYTHTDTHV